jgi:hypothetical protein
MGYGQRLDRRMDSISAPIFNFRYASPDYIVIYQRVRGIRIKLTMKTLDEGNDYRVRIKLSNRVRIIGDLICSDFNPSNFLYLGGVGIRL